MIDRVIWIVLDSVGIGELPDANRYGDVGSNTIGNIKKIYPDFNLPNMIKLGLANIQGVDYFKNEETPIGCYGKLAEISNGKDTTVGHFEMAGIYSKEPFPTFPEGFPKEMIENFEQQIGTKILGNKVASGTEIINELGEMHIKTGYPIVYTSADSVFQIAAHEDIIEINRLYEICGIARDLLSGDMGVARVIARPFNGNLGNFERTANRRDFALDPAGETVLDKIKKKGLNVMAVGKIEDIFNKKGITEAIHTKDNSDGIDKTLEYMQTNKKGLIFTNLVDFDMRWGHRRDVEGYKKGLEEFDKRLVEIINNMKETDVLFINADHGCDPTFHGTDHTREYIPCLIYGKKINKNIDIGVRETFADIGQTIADVLNVEKLSIGKSLKKIIAEE